MDEDNGQPYRRTCAPTAFSPDRHIHPINSLCRHYHPEDISNLRPLPQLNINNCHKLTLR